MVKVQFSELKPGNHFSNIDNDDIQYVKLKGWALHTIPDEEIGEDYYNAVNLRTGELIGFADKDYINKLEI